MRALLTCLLIGCAGPAQAMNWEGHDDWMADLAPALLYREAVPQARALPPERKSGCPSTLPGAQGNPYEQVPLVRPDCRAPQEEREDGR